MSSSSDIQGAMVGGKPYKTYIKRILGRVHVIALNMLTGVPTPESVILEGDPHKEEPRTMIDVWSEQEDYYFRKANRLHLEQGNVTEYVRKDAPRERTIEESTDDELRSLINKPFLALQNTLNKTNSIAVLFRIKVLAEELEKSEKVMRAIDSRLSEVQMAKLPKLPNAIEEEL